MTTNNVQNTTDKWDEKLRDAVKGATVSRGKRKGRLKAKCPPMGSLSAAAWCGLMININPFKVGMGQLLTMTDEGREIYHALDQKIDLLKTRIEALNLIQKS